MKKKTTRILVLCSLFIGVGAYLMMNTRVGVHVALDVIGEFGEVEVQTAAEDGPLVLTGRLTPVREISLPSEIEQASGIRMNDKRIYVCTDQTELFELDHEWNLATDAVTLVEGMLLFKQGSLEGIALDEEQLFAIGEFGAIKCWKQSENGWQRCEDIAIPDGFEDEEFSGMVVTERGRYASLDDYPVVLELETGKQLHLKAEDRLKPGRKLSEISFSGLAIAHGRIVLLSEDYTSLIIVDEANFSIQAVLGIKPCAAADIEIVGTDAYIVVDHNYNEDRTPVQVYDLSDYLK